MSDPFHIPSDWETRRARERNIREAPALPKPKPLPLPAGIHFAYLTGWKSRQEYTWCGKKAATLNRTDNADGVTCPECRAKLERDAAFMAAQDKA